ncbi:SpaA isopeptide-forming pilin-related protein [Bifidobacterium vespertilionis]|uniref:SpaA isopeptide-forming pilin-related protein n=1 Tax=Bifidobacterium vespertilionis TaxID=2562524 RepID=UPI001BDC13C4|nr:SpaA isopeptide-forming pilin-related protein [Bifidobacterium vespertilionis]MBT1180285.1 LPXTG cell wall anchor domain-containing protein [Bifidobacterium vespertilionis]
MKMRKLFAGVAAVATLLGGLALGAAANAAGDGVMTVAAVPGGTAVTLTGQNVTNPGDEFRADKDPKTTDGLRQFAYLKLANYTQDSNGEYYLTSALTSDQQAKLTEAFKALGYDANGPIKDPFTWLGSQDASKIAQNSEKAWRDFINTVNEQLGEDATNADSETLDGDKLTVDLESQGLFMIIDRSGDYTVDKDNCPVTYHQIKPILLGTKLDNVANGEGTITVSLGKDAASNVKQEQTTKCTTTGQFQKVGSKDKDKNGLAGAVFDIYKWTGTGDPNADSFTEANMTEANKVGTVTTTADGIVKFGNLAPGTYLVYESTVPAGYLAQYRAKLIVKVTGDATEPSNPLTVTITDPTNSGLLTDTGANGTKQYKNITSIIELPKTGAAGIAMFSVIGLLLAGAAGTVYLRSRKTKAMLNA